MIDEALRENGIVDGLPSDDATIVWMDAHVHLDAMSADVRAWAVREARAGRYGAMVPGVRPTQWAEARRLFDNVPRIDRAVGIHPWEMAAHDVDRVRTDWIDALERAVTKAQVVAVGEIGLDAVRLTSEASRGAAEDVFVRQLAIARQAHLPVVLHVVRAHARCVALLKTHGRGVRGMVHAFSGSVEEMRAYEDLGFVLGIGSLITRPNAHRLMRVAALVSPGAWVLETDAPFMAIGTAPKGTGVPQGIQHVAKIVAHARGFTCEEACVEAKGTYDRVFGRGKA